eukprot:2957235-Rhodomonas_salina.4
MGQGEPVWDAIIIGGGLAGAGRRSSRAMRRAGGDAAAWSRVALIRVFACTGLSAALTMLDRGGR